MLLLCVIQRHHLNREIRNSNSSLMALVARKVLQASRKDTETKRARQAITGKSSQKYTVYLRNQRAQLAFQRAGIKFRILGVIYYSSDRTAKPGKEKSCMRQKLTEPKRRKRNSGRTWLRTIRHTIRIRTFLFWPLESNGR